MQNLATLDFEYLAIRLETWASETALEILPGYRFYKPSKLMDLLRRPEFDIDTADVKEVHQIVNILREAFSYFPEERSCIKIKHGETVVATHHFYPWFDARNTLLEPMIHA